MFSNGAYSALKGYDTRTQFNVPMGQISCLRVVPPFSMSSIQRDTVTEPFVSKKVRFPCNPLIPRFNCQRTGRSFRVIQQCPCYPSSYQLAPHSGPPYHYPHNLSKLYVKGPTIK